MIAPVLRDFLVCVAVVAGTAVVAHGNDRPAASLRDGWDLTTLYRFNEAEAVFRVLVAREPSREHRYALAVGLLNRQPKSDATVGEARALFAALVAEPVPAGDEITSASRFYQARILQLHQSRPDLAAAKAQYRALADDPAGGFWSDAARVKWAILHLYEVTPWNEKPARLAAVEAELARVADPTLSKDLHVILADGYEKFGVSLPDALRHLEAAWALGIERGIDQGDFLARMGELARRTGDPVRARGYFQEFLRRFRRDERVYWISLKLAALEGGGEL